MAEAKPPGQRSIIQKPPNFSLKLQNGSLDLQFARNKKSIIRKRVAPESNKAKFNVCS